MSPQSEFHVPGTVRPLRLFGIEEGPAGDQGRIDSPADVRALAGTIGSTGHGIANNLGKHWTTTASVERAKDDLLRIAEEALKLRGLLCSLK